MPKRPHDYDYKTLYEGTLLCRNATAAPGDWEILNANTGKWQNNSKVMLPYIFNGEIGDEDVTLEEARTVAEKLNGSVDDFEVVPEPPRDDLDV